MRILWESFFKLFSSLDLPPCWVHCPTNNLNLCIQMSRLGNICNGICLVSEPDICANKPDINRCFRSLLLEISDFFWEHSLVSSEFRLQIRLCRSTSAVILNSYNLNLHSSFALKFSSMAENLRKLVMGPISQLKLSNICVKTVLSTKSQKVRE